MTTQAVIRTTKIYRWFNPYLDQELAGSTTITAKWLEITPKYPLRITRQRYLIALDLDKAIRIGVGKAILISLDGSIAKPEVELVSKDLKTYELNLPSLFESDTETLAYSTKENLPQDQTYVTVRIRSDKPVRCKRIFSRNYNTWDIESPF